MNKIAKILTITGLLTLVMSSCVKETTRSVIPSDTVELRFDNLKSPATKNFEDDINRVRVVAFDNKTGRFIINRRLEKKDGNFPSVPITAGQRDIYVIVNEPLSSEGNELDAYRVILSVDDINKLEIANNVTDKTPQPYRPTDIPMFTQYLDQKVDVSGTTLSNNVDRTMAKVNLNLKVNSKHDKFVNGKHPVIENIVIKNLPKKHYVISKQYDETNGFVSSEIQLPAETSPKDNPVYESKNTFYVPEYIVKDLNNAAYIEINGYVNGDPERKTKWIQKIGDGMANENPTNLNITRNNEYTINGEIVGYGEGVKDIVVGINIKNWDTQNVDGDVEEDNAINVSTKDVVVYDGAVTRVHFSTDQTISGNVYIEPKTTDNKDVNTIFHELAGVSAANKSYDPSKKTGYIDIVNLNMDRTPSEVTILLKASNFHREIKVSRVISDQALQKDPTPYVGTFHRWNETGERVITWSNTGTWTATVDGGGVLMDRFAGNAFMDGSMYGATPSPAEGNKVTNSSASVSGMNTVYFRVGWGSTSGAADRVRYAKINVTTTTGTKTLYLRQGDAPTDLGFTPREGTKPFSPYNLTARTLNTSLPVNGGVLAEYPSHAGAYFQWMEPTNARFAYAPDNIAGDWVYLPPVFESYWTEQVSIGSPLVRDLYETCPLGYRRVNDGSTEKEVKDEQSEMRQTLWDKPTELVPKNTMSGYYADGFFDRHKIIDKKSAGSGTKVAYRGTLFYNSDSQSKASLFFPAAGQRDVNNGNLVEAGVKGYYWTSTSTVSADVPSIPSSGVSITTMPRNAAVTIRCVKE